MLENIFKTTMFLSFAILSVSDFISFVRVSILYMKTAPELKKLGVECKLSFASLGRAVIFGFLAYFFFIC